MWTYGSREADQDRVYGRPASELAIERNHELREKLMSGEVMTKSVLDGDLVIQVRQYIALRAELMERGKVIADCIKDRGKTLVVAHGDEAFEVVKSYSLSGGDLPLTIRPAEVLGMDSIRSEQ